ncbi:hypothetical protein KDA23_06595 [Candidatus Saccharibacteria bacterium]|nr:hypothetical protein [Candidatus Saccharibacteria bacterium]
MTSGPEKITDITGEELALSNADRVGLYLRSIGEPANVVDLGHSTPGNCLALTPEARAELLAEITPAVEALGFR